MPSDTYILTISDAGVSVPSSHASTHLTGGSDAIPVASTSTSGLMSPTIFDQHVVNTAKVSNATHTGDVTDASGVLTVNKIKGIDLSTFSNNSILKTTTGGIIAPAVAGDFPILNQSTIGNANTATFATTAGSATSATTATTATSATSATTATNIAGGSVGSVPYQLASGTTSLLSAGTSGYVLTANGTSSAPSWSPINLSADIGGILPVGKGGTGLTTITGYVKGTGTSALSTSPTVPVADISGTLPIGSGGTGATALTTGYIKSNGTTLTSVATIPATDITGLPSGSVDLTTATGILPVSKGGTGSASGLFLGTALSGDPQGNVTGVLPFNNGGTGLSIANVPVEIFNNSGTPLGTGIPIFMGSSGLYEGTFQLIQNPLPVQYGGTGSYQPSGYFFGDGAGAATFSDTVPVADISGTLSVGKGGTAATSLTGYVKGNGVAAMTASTTIPMTDLTGASRGMLYRATSSNTISNAASGSWHPINGQGTLSNGVGISVGATNRFSLENTSDSTRTYIVEARARLIAGVAPIGPSNVALFSMRLYKGYDVVGATWSPIEESLIGSNRSVTAAGDGQYLVTSCIVELATNQEVAIYMSQTSSGALTIYSTDCYLSAIAII